MSSVGRWSLVVAAFGVLSAQMPDAHSAGMCHAPRLIGRTVTEARARAEHSGCRLLFKGAAVKSENLQTVAQQSKHGSTIVVWVNPACFGSAAYGPGVKEPLLTPGPTKLITGFYDAGGPLTRFSAPGCKRPEPPPGAGTVEVISSATGDLVASRTSARGEFVEILLPAGSYKIVGTFLDDFVSGVHPTATQLVVIPSGDTVRQDFFLSIP